MLKQRTVGVTLFVATFLVAFSAIHQSLTLPANHVLDGFLLHVDMLPRENDHQKARLLVHEDEKPEDSRKLVQSDPPHNDTKPVKEIVPSLGLSLRFLWEQLKQQTPPGHTNEKIIANLKPRALSRTDDIVLVTHGSLFKLDTFLTQLEHWNGPASLAVYMNTLGETTPDVFDMLETFLEEHKKRLRDTSIHLYMEYTNTDKKPPPYPHNPLRNLAMDASDSDYIVALDVDFIPHPKNCYQKLSKTLRAKNYTLAKEIRLKKRIMVLPAFEVYAANGTNVAIKDQLPSSKEELYESIKANLSESFRLQRYPPGHGPTNFRKWFSPLVNAKKKKIKPIKPFYPIFYRPGFEPYVLAYRHGLPRYWNTYRGFGQNKLSWFMELHLAGYKFGSLWDFFVVHLQHPSTVSWKERHENVRRHVNFLQYLKERYPLKNNRKAIDDRYYFEFKIPWGLNTGLNTTSAQKDGNQSGTDPNVVDPSSTRGEDEPEDATLSLHDEISDEEDENDAKDQVEDMAPRLAINGSTSSLS